MGIAAILKAPRVVEFEQEEERALQPNEVRLRTLYSGISAGTELAAYRGSNPHLNKQWDGERRLFVPRSDVSQPNPVRDWGYEEVGEVIERGSDVQHLRTGDVVYGTWGHRTHRVVAEDVARDRILPAALDPLLGIFSHIGAVALNGVLDGAIRISETVAIFGLGVPGQIVAQLARGSGARVIGVDLIESRLKMARELGAIDEELNPAEGAVAERIRELTSGRGADLSFEVSGSTVALHEAIRATAYSSKVVALGFYQGESRGLLLGEEFHHNRINLICSQISGVNPELSYRWNRARLVQTVMQLQVEGRLNLRPLVTRSYPFEEVSDAFAALDQNPEQALQVVLDFTGSRN